MRLIEELERRAGAEASLFRAQLLREDVVRLTKLRGLAHSTTGIAAFKDAGKRLGWTQGDSRTSELTEVLDPLLEAVFDYELGSSEAGREDRITAAWLALHRVRMERLIGCLSTPPPRPD